LCTALHKTPDEVAEITLPQLERLTTYWRRSPPPHVLLGLLARGLVGWEATESAPAQFRESTDEEIIAFAGFAGIAPP
jgi:hypothetical protein